MTLDFMPQYIYVTVKLSELPNTQFIEEKDFETPIGEALKNILWYHDNGRHKERDYEIARLNLLVKHLEEIKQHDENMLNSFRSKINRDDANYYGFRFEVATAASLIRKKVNFEKTETPDFKIIYGNHEIFIECTSRHLDKPKSRDYKIKSAILEKSEKSYCLPNTTLFIDITNIYHHSWLKGQLIQSGQLREYVISLLESIKFGSVVLFVFILNKDLNRLELNYLRIDGYQTDLALKKFLDYYYPLGNHIVYDFVIPKRG